MAYGAFGDIRALLHAPPSQGAWEKLCAEVRLWREPELSQVVFPYVLAQLERWPDELRNIRPSWSKDLLRGRARGAHFTAMARRIEVEDVTPTPEQWETLSSLDWRSLRHLSMTRVAAQASRLDNPFVALERHDWFTRLDTISLDMFDTRALRWAFTRGALSNLESLSLHRMFIELDDLLELALAPWPRLTTLSLARSRLQRNRRSRTAGSIEPLHEDVFAPLLHTLELAHSTYGRSAHHDLRVAEWLPSIEKLSLNTQAANRSDAHLFDSALIRLLEHSDLSSLEHLHLCGNVDRRHDDALASNPTIGNLRRLEVTDVQDFSLLHELATRVVASRSFSEELKSHWSGYVGFD